MKHFSRYLLAFFSIIFLTSCNHQTLQEKEKKIIKIAYLPITHSIPVMLQDKFAENNDEDYDIELVKFSSWPELVDALRTQQVHGASVLFEVALRAKETVDDLVMVSLSHRDGNVLVVDNEIDSFQDLKGKTIAIPHRLSPQNTLLNIILEQQQFSKEEINVIELSPAEMPFSMISGTISAYIVAEPYGSIAVSSNAGKIFKTSNEIYPHSICCIMVYHKNFLDSDEEMKNWLFDNFEAALEQAEKKDKYVVDTFKAHSSVRADVIQESLSTITFDRLNLSKEEYEEITDLILKYHILDRRPNYDDFIY